MPLKVKSKVLFQKFDFKTKSSRKVVELLLITILN